MTDRQTDRQTGRNYGIDALRIVSMLMIVIHHILFHGGVLSGIEPFTIRYNLIWLIQIAVYGAVDCYALISGYVGVYSRHSYGSFLSLWLRVVFYSFGLSLINILVSPDSIGIGSLIFSLFPIFTNKYWYFTSYFVLFLFIPLLNKVLESLPKRKLQVFFILAISSFSIIIPIMSIFGGTMFLEGGFTPWWLIILYLLGGYIRKYGFLESLKKRYLVLTFVISVTLNWLIKILIQFITIHIYDSIRFDEIFVKYDSIFVLCSALSLLLLFSRINIRNVMVKIVSFISPLTFSVYLIHEHEFIRKVFFIGKFTWINKLPIWGVLPAILGCAILIFLACCCIDVGRYYLFRWLKINKRLCGLEQRIKERYYYKK